MAICYVPFDENEVDETTAAAGNRMAANAGRRAPWWKFGIGTLKSFQERGFRVIYRDSANNLANAGWGTHIYILGHGYRGLARIYASSVNPMGPSLSPIDLALHLRDRNVSRIFAGSIRIISCGSGFGRGSFAEEFSRAMGALGYRFCDIYGYTGEILYIPENLEDLHGIGGFENAVKYQKVDLRRINNGSDDGDEDPQYEGVPAHKTRRLFRQNKNVFAR